MTQNAVQWLAKADTLDGVSLKSFTSKSVGKVTAKATGVSIKNLDPATQVYYVPMSDKFSAEDITKLVEYVKNGGGLMIAGPIGGWMYANGGEINSINHSGNK